MIDPLSPDTQLTLPLHTPDWLINHTLACPAFIVWMMPFVGDDDET